jgi:L-alanine-DL-glutamate epimerase-like enolase superfamily enzyme
MLITDVRAHHIRIPYDSGVASFRHGVAATAAVDIVLVEVSTDTGITGPQVRGLTVPDAAGIAPFMEQIQRKLHLFGRYGITMFAISGLDIALWDLAGKAQGVPLHRLLARRNAHRFPLMRACCGSERLTSSPANARRRGGSAIPRSSCTRPRHRRYSPHARRSAAAFR